MAVKLGVFGLLALQLGLVSARSGQVTGAGNALSGLMALGTAPSHSSQSNTTQATCEPTIVSRQDRCDYIQSHLDTCGSDAAVIHYLKFYYCWLGRWCALRVSALASAQHYRPCLLTATPAQDVLHQQLMAESMACARLTASACPCASTPQNQHTPAHNLSVQLASIIITTHAGRRWQAPSWPSRLCSCQPCC